MCLVKILQASHPTLHSLTIKGEVLSFRNKNEKGEDRVGFLIRVQHPYEPQLFTEMHRWEDDDESWLENAGSRIALMCQYDFCSRSQGRVFAMSCRLPIKINLGLSNEQKINASAPTYFHHLLPPRGSRKTLQQKIEYVPYRSQSDIDNVLDNTVVPFK